jgi:(p)ppGpp synthase/HD superfamily hydrolase
MIKTEPFASYDRAIRFATAAHEGQFRNDGVTPYITHPLAVAHATQAPVYVKVAAILHDVIEDTATTYDDLRNAGFEERSIDIVRLLTRTRDVTYMDYIKSIATSGNRFAILVKMADIKHNASTDTRDSMKSRYRNALDTLTRSYLNLSNS